MIEVADVFRRFAADYLSAHGASMLPSHQRASKTSSTVAPQHSVARSGAAIHATPRCSLIIPATTAVVPSVTLRRSRNGSSTGRRRCCRCRISTSPSPCPPNCAKCCGPISVLAMGADAGKRRRDHRTRPRSGLRRRHRRRAGGAAHLDPAAELAPACSLPGQRRRDLC